MTKIKLHNFVLLFFLGIAWFSIRLSLGYKININQPINSIIIILIISPIVEEFIFRSNMQHYLELYFKKHIILNKTYFHITFANIITSICFACLHLFTSNIIHTMGVFLPSLCFGILYTKHENVIYPILLHMFYNLNIFIS